MRSPEPLLSGPEVADHFGIPRWTIWTWKNRKQLMPAGLVPGRGRGGHVPLYRLSDVKPLAEAYLARHADTPDPSE